MSDNLTNARNERNKFIPDGINKFVPSGINLLPQKPQEGNLEGLFASPVLRSAVGVIALLVFLMTGVIGYGSFVLAPEVKKVNNQIQIQRQLIMSFSEKESLYTALKAKLVSLGKIYEVEPDYPKILTDLEELLPAGTYLSDLTLNRKGELKLTAYAGNSSELGNFIALITDNDKGGKRFKNAILSQISFEKDTKSYKFLLEAEVKNP